MGARPAWLLRHPGLPLGEPWRPGMGCRVTLPRPTGWEGRALKALLTTSCGGTGALSGSYPVGGACSRSAPPKSAWGHVGTTAAPSRPHRVGPQSAGLQGRRQLEGAPGPASASSVSSGDVGLLEALLEDLRAGRHPAPPAATPGRRRVRMYAGSQGCTAVAGVSCGRLWVQMVARKLAHVGLEAGKVRRREPRLAKGQDPGHSWKEF